MPRGLPAAEKGLNFNTGTMREPHPHTHKSFFSQKICKGQIFMNLLKWLTLEWTVERGLIFNTVPYRDPPKKFSILKLKITFYILERTKKWAWGRIFMNLGPQMADIRVVNRKGVNPLKN